MSSEVPLICRGHPKIRFIIIVLHKRQSINLIGIQVKFSTFTRPVANFAWFGFCGLNMVAGALLKLISVSSSNYIRFMSGRE